MHWAGILEPFGEPRSRIWYLSAVPTPMTSLHLRVASSSFSVSALSHHPNDDPAYKTP